MRKTKKLSFHKWCNKHKLEMEIMRCYICSQELMANIPIEYPNNIFGLQCPPCHKCGNKNTPEKVKWTKSHMTSVLFELCPKPKSSSKKLKKKIV